MRTVRPARTAIFMCEHCRTLFRARIADRRRGWAKCCSKKCAAANKAHRRVPLPTVGPEFQFTDPRTAMRKTLADLLDMLLDVRTKHYGTANYHAMLGQALARWQATQPPEALRKPPPVGEHVLDLRLVINDVPETVARGLTGILDVRLADFERNLCNAHEDAVLLTLLITPIAPPPDRQSQGQMRGLRQPMTGFSG